MLPPILKRLQMADSESSLRNPALNLLPQVIRFVDLCAGLGGFHHALSMTAKFSSAHAPLPLSFQCVAASEIENDLRQCYVQNFPDIAASYSALPVPTQSELAAAGWNSALQRALPIFGSDGQLCSVHGDLSCFVTDDGLDLRTYPDGKVVLPEHDLLCAGFPCQPFSKSGAQRGFDDTRGTVFHTIATMMRKQRPALVLLENVGNFAKHDSGNTWKRVREILENDLGYDVIATDHLSTKKGGNGLLSPHNFGFPHHRERFFILAQRKVSLEKDSEIIKRILRKPLAESSLPSKSETVKWRIAPEKRSELALIDILSRDKTDEELEDLRQSQVSNDRVFCINHWNRLLYRLAELDMQSNSTEWRDSMPSFPIWGYELDPWNWYPADENPSHHKENFDFLMERRAQGLTAARTKVDEFSNKSVDVCRYPPGRDRSWLDELTPDNCRRWVASWPGYAAKRSEWPNWKQTYIKQNRMLALRLWTAVGGEWMRSWLDDLYEKVPAPSHQKLEWNCKGEQLDLWEHILQFRPSGLRAKRKISVPALVAMTTTQAPIVPRMSAMEKAASLGPESARGRHLTRSEALQFQGFPADWVVPESRERAFTCFGNAVHAGLVATTLIQWIGGGATDATKPPNTPI